MTDYLAVGEILRPQGVHGEIKVKPMTNNIERFEELSDAYLLKQDVYQPVKTSLVRYGDGEEAVYLRIAGVDDRNAAELLRGQYLYVDREHAVKLNENENFITDLIGLKGMTTDGEEVGELTEIMQLPANDVYVFRSRAKRTETLIPALKSVIEKNDTASGVILLNAKRFTEVAVINEI